MAQSHAESVYTRSHVNLYLEQIPHKASSCMMLRHKHQLWYMSHMLYRTMVCTLSVFVLCVTGLQGTALQAR